MAATESDKDSGYSGLESHCITFFFFVLPCSDFAFIGDVLTNLSLAIYSLCLITWEDLCMQDRLHLQSSDHQTFFGVELYVAIKFIL